VAKHDVEIRRYLAWRKTVRGKKIPIRLYEIIYVGLVMLWSKMGKPPLSRAIHEYIDRTNYKKELMSGYLFQKLINEIKENSCDDKTGYYLANSRETLSQKGLEQFDKEKDVIVQELATNNNAERYRVVFKFCELYQSWALAKKTEQAEDITKQENFEIHSELPLKINV
jgi:L-lactate utilization protein LutC